jgi:hypothetical protein
MYMYIVIDMFIQKIRSRHARADHMYMYIVIDMLMHTVCICT